MTPGAALGPVRQLGHVVEDLDRAVESWTTRLGVGPWTLIRNIELQCEYLGAPSRPVIDIALGYRGEQQIELIQQKNEAPSPYRPFIEQKRYGLHHIAFLSEDIDGHVAQLESGGMNLVCDIRMPAGGGRYVYFASPVPGEHTFIELLQATAMMKQMFAAGIAASAQWQGQGKPLVFDLGPVGRLLRWLQR